MRVVLGGVEEEVGDESGVGVWWWLVVLSLLLKMDIVVGGCWLNHNSFIRVEVMEIRRA